MENTEITKRDKADIDYMFGLYVSGYTPIQAIEIMKEKGYTDKRLAEISRKTRFLLENELLDGNGNWVEDEGGK